MSLPTPPPLPLSLRNIGFRIVLIAGLAWGAHLLLGYAMGLVETLPAASQGMVRWGVIALMLVIYALLIAVPFLPGVEIGISLMVLRGAEIAPAVYVATLSGLMLAYLVGRHLPRRTLHQLFLDLRLLRACRLLDQIEPLSQHDRLNLLRARLPGRLGDLAVTWRHVSLAVLLNIPGNAVIGGGGGICLIAGLSGLFSTRATLATLALGVAPVPLAVWLYGPTLIAP